MLKRLVTLALLVGLTFGCAGFTQTVQEHPVLVKTSVQLATVQYLKYNPKRIGPMAKNVQAVREVVESGIYVKIDEVANKLTQTLLQDPSLLPEERLLAQNLAEVLVMEFKKIAEAKGYSGDLFLDNPDLKAVALQTLQWITDAHALMAQGRQPT